jgi:hypothetical protein
MKKRGRPKIDKEFQLEEIIKNNVYSRDFTNFDGTVDRWYYDFNKHPINGLYKTEMDIFNKLSKNDIKENSPIPKSQRKYLNPKNGKYVGYTRAKNLGII